uniref:Uncharacterized protein n=1 Tax=Anabas testudineus TaxID=64144 RepID=A0A7N6F6D4_ANATE
MQGKLDSPLDGLPFSLRTATRTMMATRNVKDVAPRDTIKYRVKLEMTSLCLVGSFSVSWRIVLISPVYRGDVVLCHRLPVQKITSY